METPEIDEALCDWTYKLAATAGLWVQSSTTGAARRQSDFNDDFRNSVYRPYSGQPAGQSARRDLPLM